METIYSTATISWDHETTQGNRFIPPTRDELVEVENPDGSIALTPSPDWEPKFEAIDLETVVIVDTNTAKTGSPVVFKFSFDKAKLAEFLATYVEHLDAEGRHVLRKALEDHSGLIVPGGGLTLA